MSQEVPKEQVPQILAEYLGMEGQLVTIKLAQKFMDQVPAQGKVAVGEVFRVMSWLNGMEQGVSTRCAELKAQLPKQNMEIPVNPPPESPAEGADKAPAPHTGTPAAAISTGPVEMAQGEKIEVGVGS